MDIPSLAPSRGRLALLLASLFLLALPTAASAHAELDAATPKDGATVTGTPTEISGTYVQDLDDGSSLKLRDAGGTLIAEGIIDPDDVRRMFIPEIPELAPGEYTVRSTTISAEDGETVRATWTFTVEAAPSPSPTVAPTAAPSDTFEPSASATAPASAEPSTAASATPVPTPLGGGDGASDQSGDVLLPIIAAVALVAVGAVWFTRRGRAPTGP